MLKPAAALVRTTKDIQRLIVDLGPAKTRVQLPALVMVDRATPPMLQQLRRGITTIQLLLQQCLVHRQRKPEVGRLKFPLPVPVRSTVRLVLAPPVEPIVAVVGPAAQFG